MVWVGDDGGEAAPPGYVPPRRRRVAAFDIDRAEITMAEYRRCEADGKCRPVSMTDSLCKRLVEHSDRVPIPCVSFDEARAYCAWTGMRLPTEAEWMRAGRGDGAAPFPWGATSPENEPQLVRGNFGEKPSTGFPDYSLVPEGRPWPSDGAQGLATPCSFPAGSSAFGVCDLAGNLAEWTTTETGEPVLKGGSWLDPEPSALRLASRARLSLDEPVTGLGFYLSGFRCVRPAG
jgi:iron(II)-dependent oxidoreductase